MPNLPRFGPPDEEQRQRPGPESERHFLPPPGYQEPLEDREETPSREELRRYPKTVLLKIAIELDPDTVASSYQEGWTKDDILRVIERHIKSALGNQNIEGWPYIGNVEIFDSEIEPGGAETIRDEEEE